MYVSSGVGAHIASSDKHVINSGGKPALCILEGGGGEGVLPTWRMLSAYILL